MLDDVPSLFDVVSDDELTDVEDSVVDPCSDDELDEGSELDVFDCENEGSVNVTDVTDDDVAARVTEVVVAKVSVEDAPLAKPVVATPVTLSIPFEVATIAVPSELAPTPVVAVDPAGGIGSSVAYDPQAGRQTARPSAAIRRRVSWVM